jgi:hypothetical protein
MALIRGVLELDARRPVGDQDVRLFVRGPTTICMEVPFNSVRVGIGLSIALPNRAKKCTDHLSDRPAIF